MLAVVCFGTTGYAQPNFGNPVILNEDNGLPGNYVSAAVADEQGFIWLTTANGLARFDGSEVKVFQKQKETPLPWAITR
ncbi:MAG: hypothetical protein H6559_18985 [Lewinellaceae bacterium]|nr:hypothetical protein [Lewinellaceae bacterium]